jgi:8-oxo-dGTP pyrophosphatase MutT (NUDIX family)
VQITNFVVLYPFYRGAYADQVLFGLKKTKLCKGTWVGIGGKMEAEESFANAACRESQQEAGGLAFHTNSLMMRAVIEKEKATSCQRIFVLTVEMERAYIPNPSNEFERFSWYEFPYIWKRRENDTSWLPDPLPPGDEQWLPKILTPGTMMSVRINAQGTVVVQEEPRLQKWYGSPYSGPIV